MVEVTEDIHAEIDCFITILGCQRRDVHPWVELQNVQVSSQQYGRVLHFTHVETEVSEEKVLS